MDDRARIRREGDLVVAAICVGAGGVLILIGIVLGIARLVS